MKITPSERLYLTPNELVSFQLREKFLAEAQGSALGPAVVGQKIFTFSALEECLAAELDAPLIGELPRAFLLYRLAEELPEALGLPEAVPPARLAELAGELGDGLDRLKLADLSWDEVAGLPLQGVAARVAERLAGLGRRYDAALREARLHDAVGRRRRILARLRAGEAFDCLAGVREIVCRQPQRLSDFEADFLKALSRAVPKVDLILNVPAWVRDESVDHPSGYEHLRIIRKLEKEPSASGEGLCLSFPDGLAPDSPALFFAAEKLLAPMDEELGAEPPEPGDSLSVIKTPTAYHEVEEAGRRLRLLLAKGVPPHRLALAVPDLGVYGPLIKDVGRRFGLPFYFRRGEALKDRAPVKAAMELLDLWDSHWELARLSRLWASPYFRLGEFAPRPGPELGVTDDRAGGGFEDKLAGRRDAEGAALLALLRRLKALGENFRRGRDWPELLLNFKIALNELGWPGDQSAAPAECAGADLAAAAAFKSALGELTEGLAAAGPNAPPATPEHFRLWLGRLLSARLGDGAAGPHDGVWALNYYELHGLRFEDVFLLGLNERVFPAAAGEGGWWPHELVDKLAKTSLGRGLWVSPADRHARDEELVAAALGQADSRVRLSYGAELNGRPALPSSIVLSLLELFGDRLKVETRPWPNPPAPADARSQEELWSVLAARPESAWPPNLSAALDDPALGPALKKRRERWSAFDSTAHFHPAARARWLASLEFYQSRPLVRTEFLKNFADCPRAFWYGRALGLAWPGGPVEEWPKTAEGSVFHRTLERFFQPRLGRDWPGDLDLAAAQAELAEILGEELGAAEKSAHLVGRRPLWAPRGERLKKLLKLWLAREARLDAVRPLALEWAFGPEDPAKPPQAPPLALPLSNDGLIYLKGRADRLDRLPDGRLRVTDYKLRDGGQFKVDKHGVPTPALWPVMVYALAASSAFKSPAEACVDFMEAPEDRRPPAVPGVDARDLDLPERLKQAEGGRFNLADRLEKAWLDLSRGPFDPALAEGGRPACDRCGFSLICPGRREDAEGEGEA